VGGVSELTTVRILQGPGVDVHEPSLRGYCRAAGKEWGLEIALVSALQPAHLRSEAEAALLDPGASVILVPGTAADHVADLAASSRRVVWLDLGLAESELDPSLRGSQVRTIRGRGVEGYGWALRALIAQAAWPARTVSYGEERDQIADLRLPRGSDRPPVIVLVHGGAWRAPLERDLMDAIAVDLAQRGWATWNIEYRRVPGGGGWPSTFEDVGAAVDYLREVDAPLDLQRVGVLGHSAGGQLALWTAARHLLPASAPGANPKVEMQFAISLAGIPDLEEAARRGVYNRAVDQFIGGLPQDMPEVYAAASPRALLPLGVRQLLVQGVTDLPDSVDMNRRYTEVAAEAGDAIKLVELQHADHFDVIEPRSSAWRAVADELAMLEQPGWPAAHLHSAQ
jgi:acetyl esterase/lipase